MTTVDRIRHDLVAEREHLALSLQIVDAQIEVFDRCVQALWEPEAKAPPKRNLRVEVYKALTGEPQEFEAIYRRIGRCKRSVIRAALYWHRGKGNADYIAGKGWYRIDLRSFTQALAEAAE